MGLPATRLCFQQQQQQQIVLKTWEERETAARIKQSPERQRI